MLFEEIKIKDMTLRNRVVMAPMCMYSAGSDGKVRDWHYVHYATRAVGGVGLIVVEAIGVAPEGRITSADLGIWDDAQVEGLKSLVEAVHRQGGRIGIQLGHAGRKSTAEVPEIFAPSAIAYDGESRVPTAMSQGDINRIVADFRAGAKRALAAGFDLIQVHGAHGYLINEFLSPLTNTREDDYGGAYEGRVRFLREVLVAVRDVWPKEKPLEVRVSAEEYAENGNTAADVAEMLKQVVSIGVDSINVSTGGLTPVAPNAVKGYQIPAADVIRKAIGLPVAAGGLVTEAREAEEILAEGKADMVYLGRELLRNPYWALAAAKALEADFPWPKPYERAKR